MPWRRTILAVVAGVLVAAAANAAAGQRVRELMIVITDETLPVSVRDRAYSRTVDGLSGAVCALPGRCSRVDCDAGPTVRRDPLPSLRLPASGVTTLLGVRVRSVRSVRITLRVS